MVNLRGSVRGAALCALVCGLLLPSVARAQTTALYYESQSGDPVGQGLTRTYLAGDASFSGYQYASGVSVTITPTGSSSWYLYIEAPTGASLTTGTYLEATQTATAVTPRLSFAGSSNCGAGGLTGRFVVRELAFSGFNLSSLAVDFEQHCGNGDAALFGSLRYNSSVSTLPPFDGAYPDYRLTITPPAHGTITGGGINCSATASLCSLALVSPADVSLTATPDPGYTMLGWQGTCAGLATATVHVNQPIQCGATFDSTAAPTPRTLLYMDSRPGDPMGNGKQYFYDTSKGSFTIAKITTSAPYLALAFSGGVSWYFTFYPGANATLSTGTYFFGAAPLYTNSFAYLGINGGSYCQIDSGRFAVLELVKDIDGTVNRFAADFEAHCANSDAGLFGSVRVNSQVYSFKPFDGTYPLNHLDIVAAEHGLVSGPSLSCGPGQAACSQDYASPTQISLTATADPGYIFLGWKGTCTGRGQVVAAVRVNQVMQCEALFDSLAAPSPRTSLFMDSQPTDYIGGGRQWLYSSFDGSFTASQSSFGNRAIEIRQWGKTLWTVDFDPGPSGWRVPGSYYNATRAPFNTTSPGLSIYGDGRGCNTLTGWFRVYELSVDGTGSVTRFAADFEQHCEGADRALYGSVRFNSTVAAIAPFGGAYPDYLIAIRRPRHGMVSGGPISCGTSATACVQYLNAPADVTLMATADAGYTFSGWRGDCSGTAPVTLHVNQPRQCQAVFHGPATAISSDVDGDVTDDLVVWRASVGMFYWATSSSDYYGSGAKQWGSKSAGDVPFLADIDGDGRADLIVWRASTGTWFWLTSSTGYSYGAPGGVQFGNQSLGDVPLLADMDGDGKADPIVWRASTGTWFWLTSTTNFSYAGMHAIQWGNASLQDQPLLGDVDGDGRADLGIWRGSTGTWYWLTSATAYGYASAQAVQWGNLSLGDRPFTGDVDGDGRADVIVWRASTGTWYWLTSSSNFSYSAGGARQWGTPTDTPLLKDLDGDGLVDFTVWRPSTGTWYWLTSSSGFTGAGSQQWGSLANGDIPIGR